MGKVDRAVHSWSSILKSKPQSRQRIQTVLPSVPSISAALPLQTGQGCGSWYNSVAYSDFVILSSSFFYYLRGPFHPVAYRPRERPPVRDESRKKLPLGIVNCPRCHEFALAISKAFFFCEPCGKKPTIHDRFAFWHSPHVAQFTPSRV